jgi:hypothetical protein
MTMKIIAVAMLTCLLVGCTSTTYVEPQNFAPRTLLPVQKVTGSLNNAGACSITMTFMDNTTLYVASVDARVCGKFVTFTVTPEQPAEKP